MIETPPLGLYLRMVCPLLDGVGTFGTGSAYLSHLVLRAGYLRAVDLASSLDRAAEILQAISISLTHSGRPMGTVIASFVHVAS